MNELNNLLIELENNIQNQETLNPMVSTSAVGWHIEHTLLVLDKAIESILKSNPENYKRTFNFRRFFVFTANRIPRGKVRAPKAVQPKEEFTEDSLRSHLQNVKNNLKNLQALNPNNYFDHPFMGHLKLKSAIHFLKLHTQHHINIINDIIESKN